MTLNGPLADTGGQPRAALQVAPEPRTLPGVPIRWFTDADRQDMRNAEERRVLDELELAEARKRLPRGVPDTRAPHRDIESRPFDPTRRGRNQ